MDEPLRVQIEPVVVDTARRQADQTLDRITRRRSVEIDFDDKNYVRKLGAITGQADEFSKSMEAANARVLAFGASVGVINAISNVFKNLISSTVQVEKSLTEIKIIGNETFRDLSKTSAGVFANAKQLGVSYKDAADATLEFARQGKGLNESLDAGRAALALTRTSGIAATEAVLGLTAAVNAFGRGADAYIEYANKMSSVSDAFAVNNKDLIEGLSRSASVAQEAGVSFEELVAFITTLQEKTGRGGAVIGNSLKTIFTRVQNPEIIKDLRDLGIAVQDTVTGDFLSATQIIKNLANEFQGFDKNLKNSVLLKVGGGFQVDKFSALMNDVKSAAGTFQQSFAMASSGSGNILGRVAELNKTIDGSFTNILTSSKQLGSNIGQVAFSKDFIRLLETGGSLISSINDAIFGNGDEEDKGSTFAKGILKGIGSVISGPGLALFAGIIGKLVVDFSKFSATGIQTLIGITSKTKEEESLQRSIATVLSGNFDFQQKIFSLEGNKVRQAELLLNVYRDQADQVQKISALSKDIAPMLRDQGVSVSSGVPKVNKAASGYVPNLASAIAQEKAQSPVGSRIIVDNNFPMGGGQRSTMVYNSNETRVRNFAGSGGDAIIPNYPVNSAKGYTPNFANERTGKTLNIDGSQASVAGLTFAGETQGIMEKAKSMPIDDALLNKYKGSPFIDLLKQFERFNLVNIPVGSVYKFRKGLTGEEDTFKQDFVSKLNSKFRSNFIEFISEEISGLGLTNGGGVGENLKNLKLDVFNSSTAGYVFEDILKIPTLTNAEKVAQYKSQSETEFFDMQNLQSNFAKEYGLPDKNFKYVEVKLGEGELHDGITKKFLNQAILEGGGADPKKFGVRAKRAASGYIPNFAESIGSLKSKMKSVKKKGSGHLQDYYDVNNQGYNDSYNGNVRIKRYSLDKTLNEYTSQAGLKLKQARGSKSYDLIKNELDNYLGNSFNYEKIFDESEKSTEGTLNNIKGALAEKDFANKFKDFTPENDELAGIDFYKGNELIEVKARDKQFTQDEANAKVLAFLGSKNNPTLKNEKNETIELSNRDLSLHETFKNANKNKYLNSAKGYIPNFANVNADILTANPMISETSLDEFVNKYLGQNYSTGLSGTSANVKKLTSPSLAAEAKRDFLMSMLGVNFLATFNRDKDANLSRRLLMDAKTKTGSRSEYVPDGFMQQAGNYSKPDYTNVIEGAFSGKVKELKYEELDSKAEKIFSDGGLSSVWNEDIIKTLMQVAKKHSDSEMMGGNFQYRGSQEYKKVKAATGILRPALINGLLEGEKDVQALMLNTPKADESVVGKNSKYLALLDPKAATLRKYVSNFLLNPDKQPLDPKSPEAGQNAFNASEIVRSLDEYSPSAYGRKPISLDALKAIRNKVKSNAQLTKFFGENGGAFQPIQKNGNGTSFTSFKSSFPQEIITRMGDVLTSTAQRGGIFELSNLDFGYSGTPEEKFEFNKRQPEIDTFKNTPSFQKRQTASQAAKGYIPNFSELTGTGSGMMYQDPNYNELGGGGSGKFLAPKSGEGFGQKIFYKQGSDKLNQEYHVNKSIKEFEKENPALFAKNAIAFTNVGKILTKNGLAAGFEREVIGGAGVDEFATGTFPNKKGAVSTKAEFAFFLSELLAQAGVKNVVGEYRKKYGDNSLSIDDIYAQNFKLNDLMQSSIIGETNQFFAKKKNVSSDEVSKYINSLKGNPLINSLNEKFGSAGARHTMFDTEGFSKNAQTAAKGYVPNFAYDLGTNKDNIAIRSVTSPFDEKGNRIRGTGAVKEAIIAAIAKAKSKGFNKITADAISDASVNAFTKQFGRAVKGKNTWDISEFKNAATGYIPNFAGGGPTTTLDILKGIFKTVAPKLIETTIETLLGIQIPDGTLTLETYEKIKAALEYSSAFVDKNSITGPVFQDFYQKQQLKKGLFSLDGGKTWKKQASNAASGYTPNFSKTAINDAVMREKMQSGLSSSQISVTKDSRLSNNLNPSGFAVINKRDEPNGKVPNDRISGAYKNALRGFIPNFTDPNAIQSFVNAAPTQGGTVTAEQQAAAAASASATTATTQSVTATTGVTTAQKKLSERILEYMNSLNLSANAQAQVANVLYRYQDRLNDSANLTPLRAGRISDVIGGTGGLSPDQLSGLRNVAIPNANTQAANAQPANTQATNASNTRQEEAKKKATKSLGDLAQTAFVFQSGISFATGALSSLGKEAEALGNVLNTVGQIGYTLTQGNDLFKAVSGGKGFGQALSGASRGALDTLGIGRREGVSASGVTALRALGREGRATRAAELGINVAAGKTTAGRNAALAGAGRLGGVVAGAGGAAAAAGVAAGAVAALYLAGKGIDQFAKLVTGSAGRTEKALSLFNSLQERYNIQLSEAGRSRVSKLAEQSSVSSAGLSGYLNEQGIGLGGETFRSLKKYFGFKDYTFKDELTRAQGKSKLGFEEEGNTSLTNLFGQFLDPLVVEKTASDVKGTKVVNPFKYQTESSKMLAKVYRDIDTEIDRLTNEAIQEKIKTITPEEIESLIQSGQIKRTFTVTSQKLAGSGTKGGNNTVETRRKSNDTLRQEAGAFLGKRSIQSADAKSQIANTAISNILEPIVPKAIEAQSRLDSEKQGILIRTELLKKQLEIKQQIAKLEALTPSALESALSIQKELLSNDEAQKFALELRLKALQEERQTRAEIKDLFSKEAKDIISENLGKTAQLGVVGPQAENITNLFGNLQSAQTVNAQKEAYKEIVQNLNLAVKSSETKRKITEEENYNLEEKLYLLNSFEDSDKEQIKSIEDQIKKNSDNNAELNSSNNILNQILQSLAESLGLIEKQSIERQKQNAQLAVERSIIDRTNYYFNLRKEILSSNLEIQNKSLQRQKEQLSLAKETRDVDFQRSQFLNAPKRSQAQNEYEGAINSAKENRQASLDALSQRQKDVALQNKQAIFNEVSSRAGNDINLINRASSANSQGELQKVLEDALVKQGGTFEDKVISAAKEFYRIINNAAVDSKAGKPDKDIIAQAEAARDIEGQMEKSGSTKGIEDRINELNKKDTKESKTEAATLQGRLNEIRETAAVIASARTTQAPDEKTTKENVNKRFTTDKEIADLKKYKEETVGGGVMQAYEQLKNETDSFGNTMGKTIPLSFRDGMTSAMRELANTNSTEPLKNRLLGVANSFLQKINDGLMQNLANKILKPVMGGLGSMTDGAGMAGAAYASGGYIKGGSGSKDDVPAMLMGGEYVVTKSAVKKYGASFFDSLNNGTIQKFANGGMVSSWEENDVTKYQDPASINPYGQRKDQGLSFNENGSVIGMDSYTGTAENKQNAMMRAQSDYYAKNAQSGQGGFYTPGENGMGAIMGQRNLLSFATQQTAGTQFDKVSGARNAASVDLGAGSSNMSLFALRDQGNAKNATYLESKQKSFDLYLSGIDAAKEKANREEEIRKEQEKFLQDQKTAFRKQYQGILLNLGISVGMAGLSAAGSAASKGWSATNQASNGTATFGEKFKGALSGGTMGGETRGGISNMLNSSGYKDFSVIGSNTGQGLYEWDKKGKYYNEMSPTTFGGKYGSINDAGRLKYDKLGTPYSSQRRAAGGYVAGNGMGDNVPAMLNGGEFVVSKQAAQNIGANKLQQINSGKEGGDSSEMIVSKLDELVEKLSAVGTLNITVNSDSKGGQQSKEEGGNQDKQAKELARRIKEVVMVVLRDEKRLGGMIR